MIVITIFLFLFNLLNSLLLDIEEPTENLTESKVAQFLERFRVDNTRQSELFLRNTGDRDLSNITFYINDTLTVPVEYCPGGVITPNGVCGYNITGLEDGVYHVVSRTTA